MSAFINGSAGPSVDSNGLFVPISAAQPCGEDLSYSVEFDRIQEARREDDPTLDQGEWVVPLKQADWQYVANECADILAHRSKDIRLFVWLGESLGKLRGFEGLSEAHGLVARAMNDYWETMYPLPEQGDQEQRIGNLNWFLLRTAQLLREIPVTHSNEGNYSTADFEAARALQSAIDRDIDNADALSAGKITSAMFAKAQKATPFDFYSKLVDQISVFEQRWLELRQAIDRRLAADGPSFRGVDESLDGVRTLIARSGRGTPKIAAESETSPVATATAMRTTAYAGTIADREQALRALSDVAAFFRRTEPHSPVAYLADKAAEWGSMPLHLWLRSVMKDDNALAHIEELLGSTNVARADPPE